MKKPQKADSEWLRSWLNLGNYEDAKNIDFYRWGMLLRKRALLLSALKAGKEIKFQSHVYRALKEDPLSVGMDSVYVGDMQLPIRDVSHLDVRRLSRQLEIVPEVVKAWDLEHGDKSPVDRFLNLLGGHAQCGPGYSPIHGVQPHPLFAQAAIQNLGNGDGPMEEGPSETLLSFAYLQVKLTNDDNTLKAGFDQWLRERRAELSKTGIEALAPAKPKQRSVKVKMKLLPGLGKRWHSLQVLPYIDIELRARIDGVSKPPLAVIGKCLFPDNADSENYVRNKVKAAVNSSLQERTWKRLLEEGIQKLMLKHPPE